MYNVRVLVSVFVCACTHAPQLADSKNSHPDHHHGDCCQDNSAILRALGIGVVR